MKTPYDLFATFAELGNTARQNIVDLMKSHGVKSLNTNVYMYDYGYDGDVVWCDAEEWSQQQDC